jgi:hypothetical protein
MFDFKFLSPETLDLASLYVELEGSKSRLEQQRPQKYETLLDLQETALLGKVDRAKLEAAQADASDLEQKVLAAERAMLRIKEEQLPQGIEGDLDNHLKKFSTFKAQLDRRETEAARRVHLADQISAFLRGSDPSGLKVFATAVAELQKLVAIIAEDPESINFAILKTFTGFLQNKWDVGPHKWTSHHIKLTSEALKDCQENSGQNLRFQEKQNRLKLLPAQVIAYARQQAGVEAPTPKKPGAGIIDKISGLFLRP